MKPDPDDPDLPLARLFQTWPASAGVFLERRMLCSGCPIAPFHTVIEACAEYGLDEGEVRRALRLVVMP
ncbi:hypothetical protein EBL89_06155 [Cereibacter sphaeroides]|uniref:DUF1858 domain-containing protein n=1 Tax=Cereibacter sphaeroides TaxID=1063 RepID=UPI000F531A86|nr:DUF1858 domain-containing protein [Cereibacter sphaeroides]AZB56804.1 hypothetical protein EBL89_06155 [Cereibacter sphaeroides]AZB59168.1 hypothetical protein EBL88_06090 [Cereibacter sphaeroides]